MRITLSPGSKSGQTLVTQNVDRLHQAARSRAVIDFPAAASSSRKPSKGADAMLVVGSSLIVYSGFRFAQMAARRGIPIAAGKLRASVFVPALGEPSTGQAAFSSDANVHAAAWRPARLKIAENRLKFREELQRHPFWL
jgi:hypothetical protein